MREIFQMWKLVRLLYKNRIALAIVATREDSKRNLDNKIEKAVLEEFNELEEPPSREERRKVLKELLDKKTEEYKPHEDYFLESDFYNYHKEARVKRYDLEEIYLKQDLDETNLFVIKDEKEKNKCRSLRIEFNSILESCIDPEHNYIAVDPDDNERIYVTARGKKFVGVDGLLKAEIVDGLGVLWTIIGTAAAAAASFKWQEIWNVVSSLW